MRKIHESAANVFIWLGDEADESSLAIRLIPQLSGAFSTSEAYSNEVSLRRREIHSWTSKEWEALQALLSRPWFGRMWVLQELGVASSATVVCGNQSIPWQDISHLIGLMEDNTWLALFGSSGYRSSVLAHGRLTKLLSIRQAISKNGKICSVDALYASRFFDATDPRDKIYAMIGLCMCDGHFTQPLPDYSKNVLDVYRETALAILFPQDHKLRGDSSLTFHEHPVMSLICEAERTENTYALPSWVPDWRTRPYESLWQCISRSGYKAAGASKTKISLTDNPNKITLAAKIGDAVHLVSSIAPATDNSSSYIDSLERWERYVFDRVPQSCWINESSSMAAGCQRYQDDASRDKAFGSTLIGHKAVADGASYQKSQNPATHVVLLTISCATGIFVNSCSNYVPTVW